MLLNDRGIFKKFGFPAKMSPIEVELMDIALSKIEHNVALVHSWHTGLMEQECYQCNMQMRTHFCKRKHYDHLDECAIQLTQQEVRQFSKINPKEMELMGMALYPHVIIETTMNDFNSVDLMREHVLIILGSCIPRILILLLIKMESLSNLHDGQQ